MILETGSPSMLLRNYNYTCSVLFDVADAWYSTVIMYFKLGGHRLINVFYLPWLLTPAHF